MELNSMEEKDEVYLREEVPPFLAPIVSEHWKVFLPTTKLPPTRGHEHSIVLKNGSDPISVRPYRYAQVQKDEIERLVEDMLRVGLIRPSSSPFSSPVLLVKKMTRVGGSVLTTGH